MLTFALLKQVHYISKQVIAILLLGIFVSLQAVKMLHTHSNTATTEYAYAGDLVVKKSACDICDYQLTKDVVVVCAHFEIEPIRIAKASTPFYKKFPFTSIGLYFADRGPPAVI